MKKTFLIAASLAFSQLGMMSTASAAFTPAEIIEANKVANTAFLAANPNEEVAITGYKSWKSGSDAKVRIYLSHGAHNMEVNYNCAKATAADGSSVISCTEQ